METAAALELLLLALKAGKLAYKQLELMDLETLPPAIRAALIAERDQLNAQMARLNQLGRAGD